MFGIYIFTHVRERGPKGRKVLLRNNYTIRISVMSGKHVDAARLSLLLFNLASEERGAYHHLLLLGSVGDETRHELFLPSGTHLTVPWSVQTAGANIYISVFASVCKSFVTFHAPRKERKSALRSIAKEDRDIEDLSRSTRVFDPWVWMCMCCVGVHRSGNQGDVEC